MENTSREEIKKTNEEKLDTLFDELVPDEGKADTVAGEIVRAITRIGYRRWNDGDHVGVGGGKEECNPAARYLMETTDDTIKEGIRRLWGVEDDDRYDSILVQVEDAVLSYIERHPELKTTPNTVDMWDYKDEQEDWEVSEYKEW